MADTKQYVTTYIVKCDGLSGTQGRFFSKGDKIAPSAIHNIDAHIAAGDVEAAPVEAKAKPTEEKKA